MREILSRMSNDYFNILIFDERMIIEEPVEDWPIVECLMSFHSTGFPLIKAISYVELRKPFMINDLVR